MYKVLKKEELNSTVKKMTIFAPLIAKKAEPGQFIIVRAFDDSERIPLTISDFDRDSGSISIIYQIVGASTMELDRINEGEFVCDFVGPLGNKTEVNDLKKVAVIGGGVGSAIAFPIAKKLHELGAVVHSVIGFRSKELVILENEFECSSDNLIIMTDDGSYGRKGVVTEALEELMASGNEYDMVFAIGPLVMMKFVTEVANKYNTKITVSMNPIMVDGTGMCGGCRLTVDGKVRFACVDGPDFDGTLVDFDEAICRSSMYRDFESHMRDKECNLLNKEVK